MKTRTSDGFAPGSGVLEEEIIDEEEYDFEPLSWTAEDHDLQELEEETLDHDCETLGDMVRDTHLDQRMSRRIRSREDRGRRDGRGSGLGRSRGDGDDEEDDGARASRRVKPAAWREAESLSRRRDATESRR